MNVQEVTNRDEYQNLCDKHEVSFLQTWDWGEVKQPAWKAVRIKLGDYPVTVLLRKLPVVRKSFGYVPRGFKSGVVSGEMLKGLTDYCRTNLAISHLLIEPDSFDKHDIDKFLAVGFRSSGITIQPNWTNIISLDCGEDAVFASMSSNFRKKIRRAVKYGCSVEVLSCKSEEDVKRFFFFMDEIAKRSKFYVAGVAYFEKIRMIFSQNDNVRIFVVKMDGKDIGAMMSLYSKTYAYELYGGVGEEGRHVFANYLLKWEAIKYAISAGKKFYDQWGVSKWLEKDFDKSHSLYNISHFKAGFGGEYKEFLPQQVFIFDHLVNGCYSIGMKLVKLGRAIAKSAGLIKRV